MLTEINFDKYYTWKTFSNRILAKMIFMEKSSSFIKPNIVYYCIFRIRNYNLKYVFFLWFSLLSHYPHPQILSIQNDLCFHAKHFFLGAFLWWENFLACGKMARLSQIVFSLRLRTFFSLLHCSMFDVVW